MSSDSSSPSPPKTLSPSGDGDAIRKTKEERGEEGGGERRRRNSARRSTWRKENEEEEDGPSPDEISRAIRHKRAAAEYDAIDVVEAEGEEEKRDGNEKGRGNRGEGGGEIAPRRPPQPPPDLGQQSRHSTSSRQRRLSHDVALLQIQRDQMQQILEKQQQKQSLSPSKRLPPSKRVHPTPQGADGGARPKARRARLETARSFDVAGGGDPPAPGASIRGSHQQLQQHPVLSQHRQTDRKGAGGGGVGGGGEIPVIHSARLIRARDLRKFATFDFSSQEEEDAAAAELGLAGENAAGEGTRRKGSGDANSRSRSNSRSPAPTPLHSPARNARGQQQQQHHQHPHRYKGHQQRRASMASSSVSVSGPRRTSLTPSYGGGGGGGAGTPGKRSRSNSSVDSFAPSIIREKAETAAAAASGTTVAGENRSRSASTVGEAASAAPASIASHSPTVCTDPAPAVVEQDMNSGSNNTGSSSQGRQSSKVSVPQLNSTVVSQVSVLHSFPSFQ